MLFASRRPSRGRRRSLVQQSQQIWTNNEGECTELSPLLPRDQRVGLEVVKPFYLLFLLGGSRLPYLCFRFICTWQPHVLGNPFLQQDMGEGNGHWAMRASCLPKKLYRTHCYEHIKQFWFQTYTFTFCLPSNLANKSVRFWEMCSGQAVIR